jgi:hypothetical protein
MFQQPPGYPPTPPRQTPAARPPQPQPQPQYRQPGPPGPLPYGPPPGTPPQGAGYSYQQASMVPQSNGMGTAGLTLALVGLLLPCLLIFGVIFSSIGMARANSQRLPGNASRAGLAVSIIGIVGWVLLLIIIGANSSSS